MNDEWRDIIDFPTYEISSAGDVRNKRTGRILNQSRTRDGTVKVGLVNDGVQFTRVVRILVADAFVPGKTEIFNTPIHLNGKQVDNHADNLAWRPRWFAYKHAQQFNRISDIHTKGPIYDKETNRVYEDIMEAALEHGLLFKGIWRSINFGEPTFPTGQFFDFTWRK